MKRRWWTGLLIGALLLPLLSAGTVMAQDPTHPDLADTFGSFNCTNARMWAYDLNTWSKSVYYDTFLMEFGSQDDDYLSGMVTTMYSARHSLTTQATNGIGFVSPLSLRQNLRRMIVFGFDTDLEEQGSGDAFVYVGLFRLNYTRDGVLRHARGPVLGGVRDGETGAVTVFTRNLRMTWLPLA